MRIVSVLLAVCALACAQDPETGRIDVLNGQATMVLESNRPVDSAAKTFAQRYGIPISVEDPFYVHSADMKDVTADVVRTPRPGLRVFVPVGGRLEMRYAALADGRPEDVRSALEAVVDAANTQFPFGYRLHTEGEMFVFVPSKKRDEAGGVVDAPALLDRTVTIPAGTRRILEHGKLLSDALSAATGFRVSCCQAFVAGYPWGMESIHFEAHAETARSVLLRLMKHAGGRSHYVQRCDPIRPGHDTWCFIHVAGLGGSPQN